MAIAFDAFSTPAQSNGSTLTVTVSHVVSSGSNRILFAMAGTSVSDALTGVTYNGTAMTQIGKVQFNGAGYTYLYYLINPDSGTNNLVATISAATQRVKVAGLSYTGAAQSSQPDAFATTGQTGDNATVSTSTTVVASNCWIVSVVQSTRTPSVSTGLTLRGDGDVSAGGVMTADSNGTVATGAVTDTWTLTGSADRNAGMVTASFKPAVATANGNFLAFM